MGIKNALYDFENVVIEDGIFTRKDYCKQAQVGVDLSVSRILNITEPGVVLRNRTIAPAYSEILPQEFFVKDAFLRGWFLKKGTYICELNEGCNFGPNDTGLIIMRSSLNRSGVSIQSAVWDPGYTSTGSGRTLPMTIRLTVDTEQGFYLEENSRVAQLLVFQNEDTALYDGQWQGGLTTSKLS